MGLRRERSGGVAGTHWKEDVTLPTSPLRDARRARQAHIDEVPAAAITGTTTRLIRNVALPIEHGGWAFLFEPILLGLLLSPSIAGIGLGLAGLGVFLLYRPVQLALKDWLKGKRYPRTPLAERFILLYGLLASGGLLLFPASAGMTARSAFWIALLLALPFAGLQMLLVVRGRARAAVTEISGAVSLAALAPAILLANDALIPYALTLWLVPAIRAVTSILYIRARLRRSRGDAGNRIIPLAAQGAGVLILGAAWIAGLLPVTAPFALAILAVRALHGLVWAPMDIPTKQIGFQEIGFGLLTVILVAVGR